MNTQPKIFGIGLSKTGTSSLAQALQRLGFRTRDCMGAERYVRGDLSSIDMETVLAHDALTDTPIPSFYRELDARFPGSKFILTVRERDGWLKSCRKQFNERSAAAQKDAHRRLFEDLYGTNVFDEQKFAAGYERFVAGVQEYFRDRPQDLLVMDVAAGDGWEKLCPFVARPAPELPFPKANVTQIRWIDIQQIVAVAEAAGRELLKRYEGAIEPAAASLRPPLAASVLDRALRAALGRDATEAARQAAQKVLVGGLKKLAPSIEVISSAEEPPPFEQRRTWNHVWLVDPLDGSDAFAAGRPEFSVDIALVEDGKPIYGVVHAPAQGMTLFGRAGNGAYRGVGGQSPVRIAAPADDESAPVDTSPTGGHSSCALAICTRLLQPTSAAFGPAPEWKVAAAQAVLAAAELGACDAESNLEPMYNSRRLTVGRLAFLAKAPA